MRMTTTQRRPVHGMELQEVQVEYGRNAGTSGGVWGLLLLVIDERHDPDDDDGAQSNNNAIAIHNRKCPHHSFIVCDVVTIDGTLDILMHTLDR